ncbi:MAG: ABC transporter ATP-binding protein [bacterium]
MTDILLKIEDLKSYAEENRGFLRIVDGISFEVKKDEVVALFGECGSGKTTVAYSIMGAVRYMPGIIAGKIEFKGNGDLLEKLRIMCQIKRDDNGRLEIKKDVRKWNKIYEKKMREVRGKGLFLVMQGAKSSLNPFWKVKDQGAYITKNRNIDSIFKELELGDKMARFPHQLSGGECQRALLAMGLASGAELLIVDEPTVGIDDHLKDEIINLLKDYKEGKGSFKKTTSKHSLLLITHDFKVIEELADRIVVICSGRVVESGNKDEIANNPKHPYTKMLIESFKTKDEKGKPLPLLSVSEGDIPHLDREYKGCRFYSRCEVKQDKCSSEEPEMVEYGTHAIRCWQVRKTND